MADIFISYAREDGQQARRLAEALSGTWSVFWDKAIPTGQIFEDVIAERIDAANAVIVLWSSASVRSGWVRREARRAVQQDKLFPVLVEEVEPPWTFEEFQSCNLCDWDGRREDAAFKRLAADIESSLQRASRQAAFLHPGETNSSEARPDSPVVFISYATEDSEAAREIHRALNRAGIRSWVDRDRLSGDAPWYNALEWTIEEADYVVAVNSRSLKTKTGGSFYVNREIQFAVQQSRNGRPGMFVIPVLLDSARLAEPLVGFPAVDLRRPEGLAALVRLIWNDVKNLGPRRP